MTSVTVRRGEKVDIGVISDFNILMARETETLDLDPATIRAGVSAVMENDRLGYYLVAEKEGRVSACMMITYEWSDWRNGSFWWIQSVYVEKNARRSGLFKTLYDNVKHQAQIDQSCIGLRLYVEKNNDKAQKTYEALGMKRTQYNLYETLL